MAHLLVLAIAPPVSGVYGRYTRTLITVADGTVVAAIRIGYIAPRVYGRYTL